MATSTFTRKIEITDPESVKKLISVIEKKTSADPIATKPYDSEERKKSVLLLRQCLSRSRDRPDNR